LGNTSDETAHAIMMNFYHLLDSQCAVEKAEFVNICCEVVARLDDQVDESPVRLPERYTGTATSVGTPSRVLSGESLETPAVYADSTSSSATLASPSAAVDTHLRPAALVMLDRAASAGHWQARHNVVKPLESHETIEAMVAYASYLRPFDNALRALKGQVRWSVAHGEEERAQESPSSSWHSAPRNADRYAVSQGWSQLLSMLEMAALEMGYRGLSDH
jgi:hypothetical protein